MTTGRLNQAIAVAGIDFNTTVIAQIDGAERAQQIAQIQISAQIKLFAGMGPERLQQWNVPGIGRLTGRAPDRHTPFGLAR